MGQARRKDHNADATDHDLDTIFHDTICLRYPWNVGGVNDWSARHATNNRDQRRSAVRVHRLDLVLAGKVCQRL